MIVPDVNVLVYAAAAESAHHVVARTWWEDVLSSSAPVGLPWVVASGFLRVVSNARIFREPYPATDAMDIIDGWLAQPALVTIGPGKQHATLLRRYLEHVPAGGNAVPDAHLAAITTEHAGTLWSTDRGFARFDGLHWRDPLSTPRG